MGNDDTNVSRVLRSDSTLGHKAGGHPQARNLRKWLQHAGRWLWKEGWADWHNCACAGKSLPGRKWRECLQRPQRAANSSARASGREAAGQRWDVRQGSAPSGQRLWGALARPASIHCNKHHHEVTARGASCVHCKTASGGSCLFFPQPTGELAGSAGPETPSGSPLLGDRAILHL